MNHKAPVTGYASEKTIVKGRRVAQLCRYDRYRSELLDALRHRRGRNFVENRSLIVIEALDALLIAEGLLPDDAPRLVDLITGEEGGGP